MVRSILVTAHLDIAVGDVGVVVVAIDGKHRQVGALRGQRCRAVAVVKVQIQNRHPLHLAGGLQRVSRHDQAIERAKALAVVRVRVMEPAGQRRCRPLA